MRLWRLLADTYTAIADITNIHLHENSPKTSQMILTYSIGNKQLAQRQQQNFIQSAKY